MGNAAAQAVASGALIGWMAMLSIVDIRDRRLPNLLTLPGAVVIVAVATICGRGPASLLGAAALAGGYLLVHACAPAALGAGDVKLALGLGALTGALGAAVWAVAALGAPLLTAVWGVVVLAVRGDRTVPHGPSMCLATTAAVALAVCAG